MPSTEVQVGIALLLEQCAQQRAGVVVGGGMDEVAWLMRMLQAEAAGRELMAALIRPDPYPDLSLGARIRRLVGYVQTVLSASSPDDLLAPLITTRVQHVSIGAEATRLLCDAALLLLLAAWDGGAQNIDVLLGDAPEGVGLIVESDQSGSMAELPTLSPLRERVRTCGGMWEGIQAAHGGSWQLHLVVPAQNVGASACGGVS